MSLPYNAPVKVHKFNRRYVLRDPLNKEIIEFAVNSNALDYEKRLVINMQFIADLMNGRKSVSYDNNSKGYEIEHHLNAPEPPAANVAIPGLIANAEQAQVERIVKGIRASEGVAPMAVAPAHLVGKAHEVVPDALPVEHKPSIVEKVKEAVKRRGRPKKK